ncbi:YggS family pyridoxal phosphate-dependent enzyme [Jeongeupia naejangsanensis]|uniref:Pyridoxal phosphate homeostasis protein n=1 Tax=Jeongeupia naejangsanensis TaxID=613195 RepID=A0ABS2BM31_9NEIS|nr:YggS family pyridoxal phosphate-dependent enzyme [Jeongeupia naejangsanensis]
MATMFEAWQDVLRRIDEAVVSIQRPRDSVRLLAVSKTFPAEAVRTLYGHGQRAFGENYVQEFAAKRAALADLDEIEWHFIGPLQSNKTRSVAEGADWVHAVDRQKIAERLSAQRPDTLGELNVCIQVNVSGEVSKSGVAPDEVVTLANAIAALPRLKLRGLMCIPEPTDDTRKLSTQFALLRKLQQQLNDEGYRIDTLSMGMSADLEVAIAEGATLVRIGTAIFGRRTTPH